MSAQEPPSAGGRTYVESRNPGSCIASKRFLQTAGGAFPDFPSVKELQDGNLERTELLDRLWQRT